MATAMQATGGAKWGISLGTKNWQEYLPFLWSNGGVVMDEQGKFQLDDPLSKYLNPLRYPPGTHVAFKLASLAAPSEERAMLWGILLQVSYSRSEGGSG
jgi:hypothetical protein